jgi:hypothetical protein
MVRTKPMKLFYKILIISSAIVSSIIILFILFFAWKMPFNNVYLTMFQYDFNKSINQLNPMQSNLIAEAAEVSNWANGNQCEFLVGQFRSSALSKEEIEKIYPYDFFTAGVYFFDNNKEEDYGTPWRNWKERYLENYKYKEGENVYLVWKSKTDYNVSGDIRCH